MAAAQATVDALDPSNSSKATLKLENTEKRDTLIAQEGRYQQEWQNSKVFQADAPSLSEAPYDSISADELRAKHPKWFGTMPYPYMNGTGHAGHSFTISKLEFAVGVERMNGRRVLYPQGYHCTGMPIKACADKLVREIEMFGKNFERCPETAVVNGEAPNEAPAPTQQQTKEDVTKFSAKKSKAASKAVKLKYQFQIMLAIGTPLEDIHKFADPLHWLQHFPPLWKRDLTKFGCRIDWRRSFVTTDANPYYDSFVRWQMNRLKHMDKVKYGKRYTVYSPKDGQACMDHDRAEGEGVGVQEYTALKLKVKEWPEAAQKKLAGKIAADANVFFVPATLRPETMYGQNCCFVGPKIAYGIFKAREKEYFFISERAARNMAFQNIFTTWGEFPKVADLEGSEVVGTLVQAPLSVHEQGIRILPMETVKATKGTGVVTCVPSDSPDDYATILDLAKKAEYYGIKREWAELEIVPLIETPSYGNLTAKHLVEKLKINSPKDAKPLAEAKDLAYKEGFYKGTMVYGDFKGESVIDAKPKVRNQLIESGDAFNYAEPDGFVLSRSADECVAGHLDQWYMNYGTYENGGDGAWQQQLISYLNDPHTGLNTFTPDAKNAFEQTLSWLGQWACARSYGLGSKLPWDHSVMVESLSDSTIYMSYYTIAHLLHLDIFGKQRGAADIPPDQMTDEVWDYVFMRTSNTPSTSIPPSTLDLLRREFTYWYPMDLRTSGKDLIQNHLSFCLYVHVALFNREYWPKAVRVNGHLLLNGEKMSKSTGNFLTLAEATAKFGADATRVALADAGDGIDDANFDESVANSTILRLYELRKWCEDMVQSVHLVSSPSEYTSLRDGEYRKNPDVVQRSGAYLFWDQLFLNELHTLSAATISNYRSYLFKAALKSGLYDLSSARDFYRETTRSAGHGMHSDLIRKYIELQALMLQPIAPHWSEYIWRDVLRHPSTIQTATWPTIPQPNAALTASYDYVRATTSAITSAEGAQQKKLAKGKTSSYDPKADKKLTIFVAARFPEWQDRTLDLVRQNFKNMALDVKAVSQALPKAETKKAMPFVQGLKKRLESGEDTQEVFERKLRFDELEVLKEM
ncbi:MAG: hypothetical protein Q9162_006255, partial [Coniocarpon cinnabarinum]